MTKRLMLSVLLAGALLAGMLSGAHAQGSNLWQAKASGSFVTLRYGPLDEREKPLFLLSCLNGVNIAVLSVHMDFPQREPGDAITIQLSAGGQSTSVAGESAHEDGTGVIYFEAGDIAVKPILKILSEKGQVSMTTGAIGNDLSEDGRTAAVAEFSKDCKLD
ncbi:MAG: hypothetical protein ACSLE4_07520 [Methyloceanibacter sp.]|uniref:hypothetical protein n=1 Tax=Methyloceanibacter sp. TaxID=1965321 RepID=UPI003EE03F18